MTSKAEGEHKIWVKSTLTAHSVRLESINKTIDKVEFLLREQNGRIRRNESSISKILGIGSAVTTLFTGIIAWLFNK